MAASMRGMTCLRNVFSVIDRRNNLNKSNQMTWCCLQYLYTQRHLSTVSGNSNEISTDAEIKQTLYSLPQHQKSSNPPSGVERGLGRTQDEQSWRVLMKPDSPQDSRILRVAIIGTPNAGKSTLINRLMGWRVSAVSKKVHTTRRNTMAVFTEDNTQIVFVDTPGILHPSKRKRHNLERSLVTDPSLSVETADIVGVLVDVSNQWTRHSLDQVLLETLHLHPHTPTLLILNKVDALTKKQLLLQITQQLTEGVVGGVETRVAKKQPNRGFKKVDLEKYFKQLESVAEKSPRVATLSEFENKNTDLNRISSDSNNTINKDSLSSKEIKIHSESTVSEKQENGIHEEDSRAILKQETEDKPARFEDRHILPLGWRAEKSSDEKDPRWPTEHEKRQQLREKTRNRKGWPGFERVFMVSSLSGDGVEELRNYLLSRASPGEWEYHSSVVTDQDPREVARMCVWERLLEYLPDEIPYTLHPEIIEWDVDEDGTLKIFMDVITSNSRHPKLILGKDGSLIQKIAAEAKQEIMNTFRTEVRLRVNVRIGKR